METFSFFWKCLFSLSIVLYLTEGSIIKFNGTPSDVKDGLTPNVTLRCGLHESAASGGIVGKRDVTQTQDNVAEVTSVIVMKNGADIASVSHADPAHVMDGSTNSRVTGSVAPAGAGEQGFLQLMFEDPDRNQTGEFVCEVNAVTHSGHMVTFSSSLEISVSTPTTADLVQYIRQVNREKEEMKKEDQVLKTELTALKNKVNTVVLFSAGLTHDVNLPLNQVLVFDKVFINVGGDYSSSTGSFVCSVPGYYLFEMSALSIHQQMFALYLAQNNQKILSFHGPAGQGHQGSSQTTILKLSKNDVVSVKAYSTTQVFGRPDDIHTSFTGLLVASI